MKIVLDTNVLISAVGWPDSNARKILELILDRKYTLILSSQIIDEYTRVLKRKKLGFVKNDIDKFILLLLNIGETYEPSIKIDIVKDDPHDNKFIECAYTANAQYIISGDKHLLSVGSYKKIRIINPKDFLSII
jgi:uncharacterized protein